MSDCTAAFASALDDAAGATLAAGLGGAGVICIFGSNGIAGALIGSSGFEFLENDLGIPGFGGSGKGEMLRVLGAPETFAGPVAADASEIGGELGLFNSPVRRARHWLTRPWALL